MKDDVNTLIQHYATVTDGTSALFKESLDALCEKHGVSSESFCHTFAREIAEAFVAERIDYETGDFAMNDLFWASRCSLTGFALEVFYAFEEGEIMDPRFPPGTVPWRDYTLPGVISALKSDNESRGPN